MLRFLIAFLLFFLVSSSANAVTGCIDAARTTIYTTQHPSGKYWATGTFTSTPGCFYVYTGAVCSIGSQNANNGSLGDNTNPQECPIDDYIWVMMALFGGLGYFAIRKNVLKFANI